METVLIASLGDSPVVVTAMFDLLQKEYKRIDRLEVIYPASEFAAVAYDDLIHPSLEGKCKVDGFPLASEDVSGEDAAYDFLRELYSRLNEHQDNGDVVYLSLAGGRKSMAALMALLTPLFPCVQKLYHILDKDEGSKADHFLSTGRLYDLPLAEQQRRLFPPHECVKLLSIPYGQKQPLNAEMRSRLHGMIDEQLDELWESDSALAQTVTYYRQMNKPIRVELTKAVVEQYREMRLFDVTHAEHFARCFNQMHFAVYIDRNAHDIYSYKKEGLHFHFYKRDDTPERPVFHTEPVDIKANPEADITRLVVSALPIEEQSRQIKYPPLKDIVKKLKFPLETEKLEDAFPEESTEPKEHILIVPLATSPMVATQLYRLYIDKGYTIHSVVLVHTQHRDVLASVKIASDAFEGVHVKCDPVPLEGYEDIDTPEACEAYQKLLEETIRTTHDNNPNCQIELAISGGRKGMSALATFAAQRQGIRRVAHTTIIRERVNDKVANETNIEELQKLERTNNKPLRDKRLFLRAYEKDKDAFVLFKIPVLPLQKWSGESSQ